MNTFITYMRTKWLSIATTWLGVYPILTVVAWLLEPYLASQPIAIRSLVMSALMVPMMVLIVMPLMQSMTKRINIDED